MSGVFYISYQDEWKCIVVFVPSTLTICINQGMEKKGKRRNKIDTYK